MINGSWTFTFQAGTWIPGNPAFDAQHRGLRYGDGVFDAIAVIDHQARNLDLHYARFSGGAAILGITHLTLTSYQHFEEALKDLITQIPSYSVQLRLRIQLDRSPGGLYLPVNDDGSLWATAMEVVIPETQQVLDWYPLHSDYAVYTPISQFKTLNALAAVQHNRLHAKNQTNAEPIILNKSGDIVSGLASSVCWRIGAKWYAPAIEAGGITSTRLQELMPKLQIELGLYPYQDLEKAEEIWWPNALTIKKWFKVA